MLINGFLRTSIKRRGAIRQIPPVIIRSSPVFYYSTQKPNQDKTIQKTLSPEVNDYLDRLLQEKLPDLYQRMQGKTEFSPEDLASLQDYDKPLTSLIDAVKERAQTYPELKAELGDMLDEIDSEEKSTSWLYSKTFFQCFAEINGTEYGFSVLDATKLKRRYFEQLQRFESTLIPALERDGIDADMIEDIHELYRVRAGITLKELKRSTRELAGFMKRYPGFRYTGTVGGNEGSGWGLYYWPPFVSFEEMGKRLKNAVWNALHPFYNSPSQFPARNIRRFRGTIGLMRAIDRGLTPREIDYIYDYKNQVSLTPERKKMIDEAVLTARFGKKSRKEFAEIMKNLLKKLPQGECREYVEWLMVYEGPVDHPTTPEEELEVIAEMFPYQERVFPKPVQQVANELKDHILTNIDTYYATNPSKYKEAMAQFKVFSSVIDYFTTEKVQKALDIAHTICETEMTAQQELDFVSFFIDENDDLEDALVNDIVNAHPVAVKLWGNRAKHLFSERIGYTQQFEDHFTTYRDIDDHPKAKKHFEENIHGVYNSPAPVSDWRNALEEIFHYKLIRLSEDYLGVDLDTSIGQAQFNAILHTFDISPGESSLDRSHTYPPPHHTYEELPLLKFDGYEMDFDGVQQAAMERQQRISEIRKEIDSELRSILNPQKLQQQQKQQEQL